MNRASGFLVWIAVALLGAFAFGTIALAHGERISALWVVIASVCVYLIAYRFYSRFIADKVLQLDGLRMTPAVRHNDGLDYVPTNKCVLFGHHFAAIAGAGPLVGPVLAAQMGYLPGTLWILAGVVFAGAVQDFIILFISMRRDGRSLGDLVKMELGAVPGVIALFGVLAHHDHHSRGARAGRRQGAGRLSPWGTFTVGATIPIALLHGHLHALHPAGPDRRGVDHRLRAADGRDRVRPARRRDPRRSAPLFTFDGTQLAWMLIGYGFFASVLPVWLLLAPRDYLSTFLKIGTIVALAIGILIVAPELQMPAVHASSSTAAARSCPAACSRSCSSPSPAARCPASTR